MTRYHTRIEDRPEQAYGFRAGDSVRMPEGETVGEVLAVISPETLRVQWPHGPHGTHGYISGESAQVVQASEAREHTAAAVADARAAAEEQTGDELRDASGADDARTDAAVAE